MWGTAGRLWPVVQSPASPTGHLAAGVFSHRRQWGGERAHTRDPRCRSRHRQVDARRRPEAGLAADGGRGTAVVRGPGRAGSSGVRVRAAARACSGHRRRTGRSAGRAAPRWGRAHPAPVRGRDPARLAAGRRRGGPRVAGAGRGAHAAPGRRGRHPAHRRRPRLAGSGRRGLGGRADRRRLRRLTRPGAPHVRRLRPRGRTGAARLRGLPGQPRRRHALRLSPLSTRHLRHGVRGARADRRTGSPARAPLRQRRARRRAPRSRHGRPGPAHGRRRLPGTRRVRPGNPDLHRRRATGTGRGRRTVPRAPDGTFGIG